MVQFVRSIVRSERNIMDNRLRAVLAKAHFRSLIDGEMPCDYTGINLLGEEDEPFISPRVLACFYVAEADERAVDMIVVVYGGAGKDFIKTELGVVSRMKIDGRRIREQSGERLTSLAELLESESDELTPVRQALHQKQLPLAVVLVGRKPRDLKREAFLWQLPFLESTSVLEKVQERLGAYLG